METSNRSRGRSRSNRIGTFLLCLFLTSAALFSLAPTLSAATTEEYSILKTLNAHDSGIIEVAWSPDGTLVATASWDSTVMIWSTSSWTEVASLEDHTAAVYSLEWSPDGDLLATCSWDDTVQIWDTTDWTSSETLDDPAGNVRSVAWSPDGAYLAAGSDDDKVWVWDADTWEVETSYSCSDVPWSIDWSPDSGLIAAGQYDYVVSVWDTADDVWVKTLEGTGDNVFSVAFSNGGDELAGGTDTSQVVVWDVDTWDEVKSLSLGGRVFSLSWSPDDGRLATGSWDNYVTFWDTDAWSFVEEVELTEDVYSVRWSPDGDLVACGCDDGTLTVIKRTVNEPPTAAIDGDGLLMVDETGSFDGTGSYDTDGSIASYDWDFGDGSTHGSGPSTSHSYSTSGTYTVTLTVNDDDGATDTDTLTVTVLTPSEAIDVLAGIKDAMGLHHGIENSLDKKLENAQKSLAKGNDDAAINKMEAFVNEVEAQRGKKITEEQADTLVGYAEWIIANI